MKRIAISIFALMNCFVFAEDSLGKQNAETLHNQGFENGVEGWNLWGGEIISNALRTGLRGLQILNKEHKWSGADQIVLLPEGAHTVEVSGWLKAEWVQSGEQPWEQARIAVEFLDAGGSLHGGYPPVVGQVAKTTPWTFFERTYPVRKGAAKIKLQLALGNARGEVFFDDLSIKIKNVNGDYLRAKKNTGPLDYGDYYRFPKEKSDASSHYVDWSNLLDAPAGKHGFLTVKDGRFLFEDGTPIKFWGTNLVAKNLFLEKVEVDALVSRLAKMGVNLLRLHHADAPWSKPNLFGNKEGTRSLDPEALDKFDYLIASLKQKGIYVFLDWLVHREFTPSDGVDNKLPDLGAKQVGFFDPKIIELQKEFIKNLMLHKNPYTGLAYNEEPAIVASEFINESSLFTHFSGDLLGEGHYGQELQKQFNAMGYEGKLPVFGLDWSRGKGVLRAESDGNIKEGMAFRYQKESEYYQTMLEYARSLGIRYPLAGSNFPPPILGAIKANSLLDFSISNDYWDHPKVWLINNDWMRKLYAPFDNSSQLLSPAKNLVHAKSFFKLVNKPLMITEWNHCYPNEYQLEGVPLMSFYSALQGWDGVLQFDFTPTPLGKTRIDSYTLSQSPEDMVNWVIAAPVFLRGQIQKAPGIVVEPIDEKTTLMPPSYSSFLDQKFYLPFVTRVAKEFKEGDVPNIQKFEQFHQQSEGVIYAETGELAYNYKRGVLVTLSEKIHGAVGDLRGNDLDLPLLKIKLQNPQAAVFVMSKENQSITDSKILYLVVNTPSKMQGQEYNYNRTALKNTGEEGDVLIQQPEGEVVLKWLKGKNAKIYGLYPNGEVEKEYPLLKTSQGPMIDLKSVKSAVFRIELE